MRSRAGILLLGLALGAAPGRGRSDSRRPVEPAPIEELGPPVLAPDSAALTPPAVAPPVAPQVTIEPLGTTVTVATSRRSARLLGRWRVRAPAGPLRLVFLSSQSAVEFRLAGAGSAEDPLRPEEVVREDGGPQAAEPDVRIDAQSGEVYAREPAPRDPRPRFRHTLLIEIPGSGEVELRASASLSAGFDRYRWRETGFERAHALHLRRDPFIYHYTARGPVEPIRLIAPPGSAAAARRDPETGRLVIAAAERYVLPVAFTLGLGPAVSDRRAALPQSPPQPEQNGPSLSSTIWQGLLRASFDFLLPHRDALALAADLGTDFRGAHHVSAALVYKLYAPAWPFLPLAAHLDLGAACDLWQSAGQGQGLVAMPSLRCGPRLALAAFVRFIGLLPSLDLFPQREADPATGTERLTTRYRFALLLQVGL